MPIYFLFPMPLSDIRLTQTIQQIELLDSQLEKIEAEMTDIMKFNDSVYKMSRPNVQKILYKNVQLVCLP